jgi:hypothetical protein
MDEEQKGLIQAVQPARKSNLDFWVVALRFSQVMCRRLWIQLLIVPFNVCEPWFIAMLS